MSEGQERPAPKSWLSETVVLFLAPALAYFLAFKYEEGYCGTFGVPAYLIKPDLTEILIFTSVSMGYSIWLFWIVDSWLDMGERNTDPQLRSWQHLMGRYFPLFTVFIFFIILYAEFWQKWIWFLSV